MNFRPEPGVRYDMPVTFGRSRVPDRTMVARAQACVLSYPVDADVVLPLLPDGFSVPAAPMMTVAHMTYENVDYLGGRAYNEVVVTVSASWRGSGTAIEGGFAQILWVDHAGALMAGREFMGLPKLLGSIPNLEISDGKGAFSCSEYGTVLLEGRVSNLRPIDATKMEALNARAGQVRTFGWKYIAGPNGQPDLDYPTLNVMRWIYHQAWVGTGDVILNRPTAQEAPFSAPAMAALSDISPQGVVRAFYGVGEAIIDRTETRRLRAAAP